MRPKSAVALVMLTAAFVACAGGGPASSNEVPVTLTDEAITVEGTLPSGLVSFTTSNEGTVVHELEIVEGDGSGITLSQGVADLSGVTVIDEVEDVVPGVTVELEVDLEPGVYTLLCNYPGHYEMGMVTTVTVTD